VVIVGDRVRGTVGKLSDECKTTDARSAEACAEIARLQSERAIAEAAGKLETRVRVLRIEINTLRQRGNASAPDPIGEFYAWVTRGVLSVRDVGFGFPLFFALMIEIVTAFGPITVVRFAELTATPTSTSNSDRTWPAAARRVETRPVGGFLIDRLDERVATWMSERARPRSDGRAMGLHELHEDFERWCAIAHLPTSDATSFGAALDRLRELPELSRKIRKFGDRYYGIQLVGDGLLNHDR
jgi:hypothetical protein